MGLAPQKIKNMPITVEHRLECIPYLKRAGMEEIIMVHVIDPAEAFLWANVKETIADRKKG